MEILRHSKIAITMEIYTEVVSSRHAKRSASVAISSVPDTTAALCCCTSMQNGQFLDRNRPLTWEPRYGIEP